jgi:hypothetical protein
MQLGQLGCNEWRGGLEGKEKGHINRKYTRIYNRTLSIFIQLEMGYNVSKGGSVGGRSSEMIAYTKSK